MELFIHPSPTREEIRAVASQTPELFEDGASWGVYEPNLQSGLWLKGVLGDEVVATCHFVPRTSVMAEIHPAVAKPFRLQYARLFTMACLNMGLQKWQKILAVTPTCQMTTINYAVKHGFRYEGMIEGAWRKGGKLYNLVQLSYGRNTELTGDSGNTD